MAESMSSAFTTAHRRKRLATYGKSSHSSVKTSWNDEAPSDNQPRKHVDTSARITQTRLTSLKAASASRSISTSKARPSPKVDIFDVPSDDERPSAPVLAPTRKLSKKPAQAAVFDVPESDEEVAQPQHRRSKTPQPLRRVETRQPKPSSSSKAPTSPPRKPKASEVNVAPTQKRKEQSMKHGAVTVPTATARKFHPRVAVAVQKKVDPASRLPSKIPPKTATNHDIFDVPSSGDEAPVIALRQKPAPLTRPKVQTPASRQPLSPVSSLGELSESGTRKRKRQEDALSRRLEKESDLRSKTDDTARGPHRATRESKTSDGMRKRGEHGVASKQAAGTVASTNVVNKPRRTRLRTATATVLPLMNKVPSSPAKLNGMLAVRSLNGPLAVGDIPVTNGEDVTMYDVQEPSTPPATRHHYSTAGSVTPRQKNILSALVPDADAPSTGMPSIRRLQLSDRRPGLARSASDIPQSAYTRKTRLIDSLKQAAAVSEEDSDSDSQSEQGLEEVPQAPLHGTKVESDDEVDQDIDALDMDAEAIGPSQSQSSQNMETKVTYARQRSYRQEANPEDEFLAAMDMDDLMGYNQNGRNDGQESSSEEEDDPASQLRGLHSLRREGEDQRFRLEAQTAVDDIGDKAGLGKSVRRSAMLDFSTRMADKSFLGHLLESALLQQFLESIGYTGEVIFDFAAMVAVGQLLEAGPNAAILEEIWKCGILTTLEHHLDLDTEINRIAKERKTNLSMIGRESVNNFRTMVQRFTLWSSGTPEQVTPQLVALRTLELLVLGLRKAGNTETLVSEVVVHKLLQVAATSCKGTSQDVLSLSMAFSIMEALSISASHQTTWSNSVLERVAETTATLYGGDESSAIKLATRLCILLTNNKPKACEVFARHGFVQSLVGFINRMFLRLANKAADEETEAREDLILCLGAMINIAEFSNQARVKLVANGDESIDALVGTFLEGSERAAQADSVEESQANIPVGYLTVLLGNLCLNNVVRKKIQSRLPGQRLDLLIEKVKEFVSLHERVDQMTGQFDGAEGREVSQNYTKRLMQVVRRLEQADS